jgi:CelD/BcsL family acetyltransferase involved in cellulose biosynthesis
VAQLSIEEITDVQSFSSLKEEWNVLLQKSADNNVFLTWEWLFTWWRHYGEGKQLMILLIKEGDKIIGIAPFMRVEYKRLGISVNVLENLCSTECDYSGIILIENYQECIAFLLSYLKKLIKEDKLVIRICHVPDDAIFVNTLLKQRPPNYESIFINTQPDGSCPYIELPATWDEYYRHLHKNGRKKAKKIKREIKTIQENHKVEFKKYTQGDDIQDQLQILSTLHQKRWQERNISSKFTLPKVREFHLDVSKAFIEKNWMDLSFFYVDGTAISAGWGFNYCNQFYYMTSAFDPDYKHHNPGHIHTLTLIDEAIKNGLNRFDFLKGEEFFKTYWAHNQNNNIKIVMSSKGFGGKCRVILLDIFTRLKRIQERNCIENMKILLEKIGI